MTWRENWSRVRRIHEPTTICCSTEEPSQVEEDSTKQKRPETECVNAWERNVACTNLQRNEIVCKTCRHWHNKQEHHGCCMHGEHLVVQICVQHFSVWCSKLQTNEHCFESTNDEEEQRCSRVHNAKLLVVHGEQPRLPARCGNWTLQCTKRCAWCRNC